MSTVRDDISVLIIDDSLSVRHLLRHMLQGSYTLHFAVDGAQGVEVYEQVRPDIIILDMNMPRKDGLEVIRDIRRGHGDQDVFILFLTAEQSSGLKAKALNDGANDFLTKPVDQEELLARLGVARRQVYLNRSLRSAYDAMAREMDMVVSLQHKLLPDQSPCLPGLKVMSLYQPSGRASGDYFDFFSVGDGILRTVVADVSGHGARAAFLMAIVRTLFRTTRSCYRDLTGTLTIVNEHLCQIVGQEMDFVTLFAADIDLGARTMEYINAGHCPGLLRLEDGRIETLASTSPLLGFFNIGFESLKVDLGRRAGLFLFTDGLYEWETESGDLLGLDRFCELASGLMRREGPLLDNLVAELSVHAARSPKFRDDRTALWIETEA